MTNPPPPATLAGALRTAAVVASLGACFLWSLVVGVARGSLRACANAGMSSFGDAAVALGGIDLRVEGEAHLWSHRPAVFVLNHTSALDFVIAVKLLRRDVTGVAKRELARHPIVGPIFRLGRVVFIDRADRAAAIAALRPAASVLEGGLSVAVAPEGTRGRDASAPGRFRKGAFRLAMAAGVPVVALVIDGAGRRLPRGAWVLRPGPVRVTVLPPMATRDWTAEGLDERIAALEQRYRDILGAAEAPEGTRGA